MESINYLINGHTLPCIYLITAALSSTCLPEIPSMKYYYNYILSSWKSDESKIKDLELIVKPVTAESGICPATESTNGPPEPTPKNQHEEITTYAYNADSKDGRMKKLSSGFTSMGKNENSQLDDKETQAGGAKRSSFDNHGNWTTFGMHLEILFTDKVFMQMCAVLIVLILFLMLGQLYYIKEMRSVVEHVGEVIAKPQEVAQSMELSSKKRNSERNEETMQTSNIDVSCCQNISESDEERIQISNNDELALMTLSAMVYCHLQNLANEIKKSKPEENLERYLTADFLQLISARIAQDDFMKFNFQTHLPAETLLQLGELHYYQRNRNSCNSERVSTHLDGNETVSQQHCTGKSKRQDVKVNIGVQVGGQEIKIPQSKSEKVEDKENSSD